MQVVTSDSNLIPEVGSVMLSVTLMVVMLVASATFLPSVLSPKLNASVSSATGSTTAVKSTHCRLTVEEKVNSSLIGR